MYLCLPFPHPHPSFLRPCCLSSTRNTHTQTHAQSVTNHLLLPQLRPRQFSIQESKPSVAVGAELQCLVLVLQLLDWLQLLLNLLW